MKAELTTAVNEGQLRLSMDFAELRAELVQVVRGEERVTALFTLPAPPSTDLANFFATFERLRRFISPG